MMVSLNVFVSFDCNIFFDSNIFHQVGNETELRISYVAPLACNRIASCFLSIFKVDNKGVRQPINLNLWDTAGQVRLINYHEIPLQNWLYLTFIVRLEKKTRSYSVVHRLKELRNLSVASN